MRGVTPGITACSISPTQGQRIFSRNSRKMTEPCAQIATAEVIAEKRSRNGIRKKSSTRFRSISLIILTIDVPDVAEVRSYRSSVFSRRRQRAIRSEVARFGPPWRCARRKKSTGEGQREGGRREEAALSRLARSRKSQSLSLFSFRAGGGGQKGQPVAF